jgi:hypothetical protein
MEKFRHPGNRPKGGARQSGSRWARPVGSLSRYAGLIFEAPAASSFLAFFAGRTRPKPGDRVGLNLGDVHRHIFFVLAFADLLVVLPGPEVALDEDPLCYCLMRLPALTMSTSVWTNSTVFP